MEKVAYSFIPLYHAIKILALESAFWPDIDKAFNDLKPKSLVAAKKHQLDGGRIISGLPHQAQLRAVELLGLNQLDRDIINKFTFRVFKHELTWIGENKDHLNFATFLKKFVKKQSTNEFERLFIIFHIVVAFNHLEFDWDNDIYNESLLRVSDAYNYRHSMNQLPNPALANARSKSEARKLEKEWLERHKGIDSINQLQYSEELYGSAEIGLEQILVSDGCTMANLEEQRFSRSDISGLIETYCISCEDAPTFEGLVSFMPPALIVKVLARTIRETTNDYINLALTTETEKATTYKRQAKELTVKLNEALKVSDKRQESLNEINLSYDKLKLAYDEIKRQQVSLQEENDILLKMLNADESETPETVENYDITKAKIVVIGGHENWQNKVAALGKNITIIKGSDADFDVNLLKSAEVVVVNWTYFSHKQFFRLKTACAKEKLVYIGNNNINYFVSAVGRHLKG